MSSTDRNGVLECWSVGAVSPSHNPVGVADFSLTITQGSSSLATLGFEPESLWDSPFLFSVPKMRARCSRHSITPSLHHSMSVHLL